MQLCASALKCLIMVSWERLEGEYSQRKRLRMGINFEIKCWNGWEPEHQL